VVAANKNQASIYKHMSKPYNWNIIGDPNKHTTRSGEIRTEPIPKQSKRDNKNMADVDALKKELEEQKRIFEDYRLKTEQFVQQQTLLQTQWKTAEVLETIQVKLKELKVEGSPQKEPKEKAMNSTQPLFFGKPTENVDLWLFTTEQNFNTAHIQPQNKLITAVSYFREIAAQSYRKWITDDVNLTWDKLKELMIGHFTQPNNEDNLTKQLDNLKYSDLFKYIADFQLIPNQLKDISDRMLVYLFKKNLPGALHNEVDYLNPKTLKAAIEIAQTFYQSHPSEVQINYTKPNQ